MKIAIAGSSGNLGQQLVRVFSGNARYEVVALTRQNLDITNYDHTLSTLEHIKPNVIINATAYNMVDKCEESAAEFEAAKRVNGYGVGFLAQAALKYGCTFVHYSTDYVFSGDCEEGYPEDHATGPINNYGKSKLLGEQEIKRIAHSGLHWFLIRTSKLFGPKPDSKSSKPSFFDSMLALSRERPFLDVVNEEKSCFTYTPDLAAATRRLVESHAAFGTYHIVNDGPCTWYEAARILFDMAEIDVKIRPVHGSRFPRPARRPKFSVLLNTKLEPMRGWAAALKEHLAGFQFM